MDNRIKLLKELEKIVIKKREVIKTQNYTQAVILRDREKEILTEVEECFSDELYNMLINYRNIMDAPDEKLDSIRHIKNLIRQEKIKNILKD